jgi:excisionase family DNA binding protein
MTQAPLLSADDVADLAQVKRPTVLRWNRQGRMPAAVRLNERTLRWRPADVQAWIEQRTDKQST